MVREQASWQMAALLQGSGEEEQEKMKGEQQEQE